MCSSRAGVPAVPRANPMCCETRDNSCDAFSSRSVTVPASRKRASISGWTRGRRRDCSSASTYMRYPESVGTRPAEVCGWRTSPCSSNRARMLRTVADDRPRSLCSASQAEDTGSPCSMYSVTSRTRMRR